MAARRPDYILLGLIIILLLGGLLMLASASVAVSYSRYGSASKLIIEQLTGGVLVGSAGFMLTQRIPYAFWRKVAFPALLVSLALLAVVFTPQFGFSAGGARRWIRFQSFVFQPSELAKLAMIIYLAAFFSKYKDAISHFWQTVAPFLAVSTAILGLIALQPDIGTLGIIAATAGVMFFIAGARWKHVGMLIGILAIAFFAFILTAPYRANRFLVFLDRDFDPQGIGYQSRQALLAVGSGGLLGLGLGESGQKYNFLPESVSDSIFAIIAEELGFVGAVALVALFVAFGLRSYWIAARAPDLFAKYLAIGIASWIVIQAFVNISAVIGLIPLTGVTLPFVSHGGSSLALVLAGCGILINISKYAKQ